MVHSLWNAPYGAKRMAGLKVSSNCKAQSSGQSWRRAWRLKRYDDGSIAKEGSPLLGSVGGVLGEAAGKKS